MASNVEILFFGRPEGLEVSQSALLEGHKDSLYPEQGIAETTDGLVWRVQFFSGNTPLQVISCFKAMGSPTRGAGGHWSRRCNGNSSLMRRLQRTSK